MFVNKKTKLERLSKRPKIDLGARCAECKCFLDAKTSLTKEFFGKCPKNKW